MRNKLPAIAVLLTCHNRKEKTLRCLNYLFAQDGIAANFIIEVFLVDDASIDGTGDAVRNIFTQVNVIKGDGNLFWGGGMNLAWETASQKNEYDFYLWLNDDTYIFPNAIEIMLESYFKSEPAAIISGSTKSEISNEHTYGGKSRKGVQIIPNGCLQKCILLNGNFVLVSNKIFKGIGLIDSIFQHTVGDHDYGLRAIKKGFPVLIAPFYIGYCEKHKSLPKWCSSDIPVLERIKSLYTPLGNHPYYFFIYEKRHFGLLTALKHFFSIHLRVIIPVLWQ